MGFLAIVLVLGLAYLFEDYRDRQEEKDAYTRWLIRRMARRIEKLENHEGENPSASKVEFYQIIDGKEERFETMKMSIDQTKKAKVKITDKGGNLAEVQNPGYSLSDESLATLVQSEDGLSCEIQPKGPLGSCEIQFDADADLGEGVKPIRAVATVEFTAGEATVVEIAFE